MSKLNTLSISVLVAFAPVPPALAQEPAGTDAAMEEVVVTGMRGTLKSAQSIKFEADTFVDSIVADDIANLPDRSVTETLQRVPGVTIDRFIDRGDPEHLAGEGTGVAIRGLTQVRGEINGRDGFTADGGRGLSFEDVPPELLAGVDVYKNATADMIEGGLGGTVNLRTRKPFDIEDRLIAFTATANYQNFIKETTPGFSALYSNRWDTGLGELGVLADVAYSELEGRIDVIFNRPFSPRDNVPGQSDTVYAPRGADWRTERTYRERQGGYLALQLSPDEDTEYFLTVFRSEYEFTWDEDAIFVDNDPFGIFPGTGPEGEDDGDWEYNANGVFQRGTLTGWSFDDTTGDGTGDTWNQIGIPMGSDVRVSSRESVTTDVSTGAEWQLDNNWLVTTELQYVKATTEGLDSTVGAGITVPQMHLDVTGETPVIDTDAAFLSDPTNYYIGFTQDHQDDNEAEQVAWRSDAEYTFDELSPLKSAKFGVRFADRDSTTIDTGYNWRAVVQPWMRWWGLPGDEPLPNIADLGLEGRVNINNFDNFFRGDIPVPGAVVAPEESLAANYPESYYTIHNAALPFYEPDSGLFSEDEDGNRVTNFSPTLIEPNHRNQQDQEIQSAYAMLRFGNDASVDGNVGLRWVRTKNVASGFVRFPDESDLPEAIQPTFAEDDIPVAATNTYDDFLPSFNLRARLTEELLVRFAWSQAIARPDFSDMKSFTQLFVDLDDGAVDGSEDLDDYSGSADAGNPDLEAMEADQVDLSLEWYYSDIGSAWLNIFKKNIDGFIRNQDFVETYNGFEYTVTRPANQDRADIDGWELGWRHFFDMGFGIETSYTRIDSSTSSSEDTVTRDTDGREFDPDGLPYEGLSENQYSITMMYEDDLISSRLAYTWRDEFLLSVGANGYNGNDEGIEWRLPVFQEAYGQWDGSIFFNINDRFALGLEANNLTNEKIRTSQKQIIPGRHPASSAVQDTRYALTLRGRF
jgi:TonB-dependent receptor